MSKEKNQSETGLGLCIYKFINMYHSCHSEIQKFSMKLIGSNSKFRGLELDFGTQIALRGPIRRGWTDGLIMSMTNPRQHTGGIRGKYQHFSLKPTKKLSNTCCFLSLELTRLHLVN